MAVENDLQIVRPFLQQVEVLLVFYQNLSWVAKGVGDRVGDRNDFEVVVYGGIDIKGLEFDVLE